MPARNNTSKPQQLWNIFPSQNEEERQAHLNKLKAEATYYENEDKRREEKHAVDLLHMLSQIEKVNNEMKVNGTSSDEQNPKTIGVDSSAIKKYIEIAIQTSSVKNVLLQHKLNSVD